MVVAQERNLRQHGLSTRSLISGRTVVSSRVARLSALPGNHQRYLPCELSAGKVTDSPGHSDRARLKQVAVEIVQPCSAATMAISA